MFLKKCFLVCQGGKHDKTSTGNNVSYTAKNARLAATCGLVFGVVCPGLKIKITLELSVLGPLVRPRTSRSLVQLALTSKHWQLACDLILR